MARPATPSQPPNDDGETLFGVPPRPVDPEYRASGIMRARRLRDPEIGAEARRRRDHGRRDGRPAADLERDARDGAAAAPADRGCDEVGRCARLPARAIRTGIGGWSKSLSYQRSAAPGRIVWPKRGGGSGRAMPRRRGSGGRDRHGARSAPPVVPAGVASDDEAVKLSRPAFGGWPILETPGAVSARAGIGRLPGCYGGCSCSSANRGSRNGSCCGGSVRPLRHIRSCWPFAPAGCNPAGEIAVQGILARRMSGRSR